MGDSWFGSIGLQYKYFIIFGGLLLLTITAGVAKLLWDRRRVKKHAKREELEAGKKEEQMELNSREKDEGDLFGVRAIEAGFYAGIPQSRPTSRATSISGSITGTPSMSTNTLIGSLASPKMHAHSAGSSVTTLPLAHTAGGNRDSDTLPSSTPVRKSRPTIKLRPSEAELSGRINHNAAVNMNLVVPPSPVLSRGPSPAFDDGSDDENNTPKSLSPRSANFRPDHYAPSPPQIPMPEGLSVRVHSPDATPNSQAGSLNYTSPSPSPGHSAPPSPGLAPETKLPSMPGQASREEPRSLFPAQTQRGPSDTRETAAEVERPSSPVQLQPSTYQPSHKKDASVASSVYSDNRRSTYHEHKRSNSTDYSYNYSFPDYSVRNSMPRRPSAASSLHPPESTASGDRANDTRLSEFYDAYYRHSQLGGGQKGEGQRRPNQLNLGQATIVEVPSPLPSPNPDAQNFSKHPGLAL